MHKDFTVNRNTMTTVPTTTTDEEMPPVPQTGTASFPHDASQDLQENEEQQQEEVIDVDGNSNDDGHITVTSGESETTGEEAEVVSVDGTKADASSTEGESQTSRSHFSSSGGAEAIIVAVLEGGADVENARPAEESVVVQAELVDEEEIRRRALQNMASATAEVLKDDDEEEDNTRTRRRRLMFVGLAVCVLIAVVVAVVVSLGDSDSSPSSSEIANLGNEPTTPAPTMAPTQSPSFAPSGMPSSAPTRLDWELVLDGENGRLDGRQGENYLDWIIKSDKGMFGQDVEILEIPQHSYLVNHTNRTHMIVGTFGEVQFFHCRTRNLRQRMDLERNEAGIRPIFKKVAFYFCDDNGCDPGTSIDFYQLPVDETTPWKISLSDDGSKLSTAADTVLAFWDFVAMGISPTEPGGIHWSVTPYDMTRGLTDIADAKLSQDGKFLSAIGRNLVIYNLTLPEPTPPIIIENPDGTMSILQPPIPMAPVGYQESFLWFPPMSPFYSNTLAALDMDNDFVAVGTKKISYDVLPFETGRSGFEIHVFDVSGQEIGNVIEYSGTNSLISTESLALTADGTILAVGYGNFTINFDDVPDIGKVDVYHLVENEWVQLGQTITGFGSNDGFGHSVAMSEDGTHLAVGSPRDEVEGIGAGRVSGYRLVNDQWVDLGDDLFGALDGSFGSSLSMTADGSRLLVGAPTTSLQGDNTGEAFLYKIISE